MIKNIKKYKEILIIIFVFAIVSFVLVSRVIHHLDYVPDWDESLHLWMGLKYQQALFPFDQKLFLHSFINSNQLYPPFYHAVISLWYQLSGIKNWLTVVIGLTILPLITIFILI